MAVSGIALLGFVLAHMIGNLKVFLGKTEINTYAHWLRTLGEPALPYTVVLWALRVGLTVAFVVHIVAAAQLTRMNHRARPQRYQSKRDYVAANYASRTMRWTGIIVGLFVIFHLLDLTWGQLSPHFVRGDPYDNMYLSFQRVWVAVVYIVANIALGIHIFHGAWSMFQSLGWNNPRYNRWRRYFATGFRRPHHRGQLQHAAAHHDRGGEPMTEYALDAKIPDGPIAEKWDEHKFDVKLVNPSNRRKFRDRRGRQRPRRRVRRGDARRARLPGHDAHVPRLSAARRTASPRRAGSTRRRTTATTATASIASSTTR